MNYNNAYFAKFPFRAFLHDRLSLNRGEALVGVVVCDASAVVAL